MSKESKVVNALLRRWHLKTLYEPNPSGSGDKLEGPLLKIERAKQHIRDLQIAIARYVEDKPYSLVLKQETESKGPVWDFRVHKPVPKIFPLFIGDAIHNLRSSFDLLANVLVIKPLDRTKVCFPICKDEEGFESAIKEAEIEHAGENVVNLIRSLKPYTGGNEALCAIRDLDDADKHRLIIPVVNNAVAPKFDIISGGGREYPLISSRNVKFGLKDGLKVIPQIPGAKNEIGEEVELAFDIEFEHGLPFERQSVIPTLVQLTQYVEGVIESFRSLL